MNPDFSDILSAFSAEQVKFLLVGAYALAVHGLSRATGDLDIWIEASPENLEPPPRDTAGHPDRTGHFANTSHDEQTRVRTAARSRRPRVA